MTQYLLQQENPLSVFGQVVRSEAALDACPNHNDITDVFLSSHDVHLALQPQSPHTKDRQAKRSSGLKEEEKGKVQRGQHSHNPLGLCPPLPQSLAQGSAWPPPRAELGSLICEI